MRTFTGYSAGLKILLVCSGVWLSGCKTVEEACPGGKATKIASTPTQIEPYKVVGRDNSTSIATAKNNLKTASAEGDYSPAIGALRAQALRETALSIGARGGLAERAQAINKILLKYEPLLAKVFAFHGLLLDDNVMPPVLSEARNTLNLSGTDSIRIADRSYKILSQARFVTATPTWREYLWMSYDVPEVPDRSLLPRNKPERMIWERNIEEGWQAGLQQAELIFRENMNRLVRDFKGMILYRKLLEQEMVSRPYVASVDMGVTGGGDGMTVHDRVLRITAFPKLQADSSGWKTEIFIHE